MLTHDRLFVSTMQGSDPATGKVPQDPAAASQSRAWIELKSVVQAAGLTLGQHGFRESLSDLRNSLQRHERAVRQALRIRQHSCPRHHPSIQSARRCTHRLHRRGRPRCQPNGKPSVRKICRPVQRPAPASSRETHCIVRQKADLFLGPTVVSTPPRLPTRLARPCATSSTISRKQI